MYNVSVTNENSYKGLSTKKEEAQNQIKTKRIEKIKK